VNSLSEELAIVGTIDPDAYAANSYETDVIALENGRRVVFVVMAGDLGSSATLDFKVQGATSSGGSYADISGASITQLTQAGSDSDKQVVLEISNEYIENLGLGYTHIKGVMTVGTATSDCGAIALQGRLRYKPASDFDLSSVDEIVQKIN
jgi:hypothetical protein